MTPLGSGSGWRSCGGKPQHGVVNLPDTPGLGMELDEAKVEEQRELRWGTEPWR